MPKDYPYRVCGVDGQGLVTLLEDFAKRSEGSNWLARYVGHEDAGGWNEVILLDTTERPWETLQTWVRGEGIREGAIG